MQFNYCFEVAAAIIMCLLLAVNYFNHNLELAKSKYFIAFGFSCLVECLMNIASSVGLSRPDVVSNSANDWICFFFFLAEATTSLLFFMYVLIICETNRKARQIFTCLSVVPYGFFLFLIFSNSKLHLIYEMKNDIYSQGPWVAYGFIYIELFLIASAAIALKGKRVIRGRNRYSVLLAVAISMVGIIIQIYVKSLLLTSFANVIVLLIFYIVVQNPNEQRDKTANVLNSRAFYLRFENSINQAKKMRILTVGIYQQAQLNETLGYKNGNIVLGEVGSYLSGLCGNKHVFLVQPSTFAVILDEKADVTAVKDQILKRFEETWELDNLETMIPVQIASIAYPDDVTSVSGFYGLLNYMTHELNQNAMKFFIEATPEIKAKYKRTSDVEKALKRALEKETLEVYYQPIYDVEKKRFTSMEALARLFDEKLGSLPPDEFIAAAERNGTIIPLDMLVLEKVCKFLKEKIIPINDKLQFESVHVNISAQQCAYQNMDEMFLAIIDKYEIPHDMISLEITERAAVTGSELMEKHMNSLISKGVKFALDDYGTGNSNCSYLISYPFDKVKFDKGMVWSYFDTTNGHIILEGEMLTLHKLNFPIVAEGVETIEQYNAMTQNGVEFIQGYYFSKPVNEEKLVEFLVEKAGE